MPFEFNKKGGEKAEECVVAKRRSNLHYINFLSVFKMHSSHTHHSRAPRAAYFCAAAAVNLISGALIICATKFNFFSSSGANKVQGLEFLVIKMCRHQVHSNLNAILPNSLKLARWRLCTLDV